MLTTTTRPSTPEEREWQRVRQPVITVVARQFFLATGFTAVLLSLPFLVINHFMHYPESVNKTGMAVIGVVAILVGVFLTWQQYKLRKAHEVALTNDLPVEIIHVKTTRAIKREDTEDYGIAFYIDVQVNGKNKTLYLWGQDFNVMEAEEIFPATSFEITRIKGSHDFLDFKITGEHFLPEKTFPAHSIEYFKKGNYPMNGDVLEQGIDEIS